MSGATMATPGPASAPCYSAGIDARLLYWTRLAPESGSQDERQRQYRFERVLPVPVESLHVVGARLDDGGSVLVGIEPERLREHLAQRPEISGETWELLPDRIPGHLEATVPATALASLNLLQGPFEPARRLRTRHRRDLAIGVGMALIVVLALVGIERRVAAQGAAVDAMRRTGQELLAQALGPSPGRLPNAALLTQELRRLEQAARNPAATALDAASVLQQLWAAWPADMRTQVETLSLAQDRLVIRGSVPTLADAERLAKACPVITAGDAVLRATPLQAEQTPRGAAFLITWYLQTPGQKGGAP